MKKILVPLLVCLMAVLLLTTCDRAEPPMAHTQPPGEQGGVSPAPEPTPEPEPEPVWVGTWASGQYYGDNTGDGGRSSALSVSKTLPDATLRQMIRTSTGGPQLRLTFSNEYGETPMTIHAAHIARATVPAGSDIDVSTDTAVTFHGGSASVTIPAGEKMTSDPIDFPVSALERIAVSAYFGDMPETVSCHVAARANSFIQPGDAVSDETLDGAASNTHWFVLCNADILSPPDHQSIVVLGDSITDGYGVTNEEYTRWVDVLMDRLQENPATRHLSVINMGIGTNCLLDQKNPLAGIDRFPRDVLEQPGVGYMIFLIGANDGEFGSRLTDAYAQMIREAQAQGILVYGCAILPNGYVSYGRYQVNDWLRQQYEEGGLDGFIDFDELMKDPDNPDCMLPEYDNDGIHPSAAGYAAMGEYVYSRIAADLAG